jgi:hypothetical protein
MNIHSYERITERIVSLLEQGTVPWHKPWTVICHLPMKIVLDKIWRQADSANQSGSINEKHH